jgi:hypothetical protein
MGHGNRDVGLVAEILLSDSEKYASYIGVGPPQCVTDSHIPTKATKNVFFPQKYLQDLCQHASSSSKISMLETRQSAGSAQVGR